MKRKELTKIFIMNQIEKKPSYIKIFQRCKGNLTIWSWSRPTQDATIHIPANTICWINVGLMLVHRRRRWTNVKPTLIQRLVSDGMIITGCSYQRRHRSRMMPINCDGACELWVFFLALLPLYMHTLSQRGSHWQKLSSATLPCKVKRQYQLTFQVRRYCLLTLQSRTLVC